MNDIILICTGCIIIADAMALQWGHDIVFFGDYRDDYFWRIVS